MTNQSKVRWLFFSEVCWGTDQPESENVSDSLKRVSIYSIRYALESTIDVSR